MDINNPIIKLCMEGNRAEFEHRIDDAKSFYVQAWKSASDNYEACIAAHYVARYQEDPEDTLMWNQEALNRANDSADERVKNFYPSLYLNMGKSYEMLSNMDIAKRYYALAATLGVVHRPE